MAEERKPASKAQQKAQNRWIASAYDRINLTVEKGRKDIIKAFADAQGESVNGFINRAVNAAMSEKGRHEVAAFIATVTAKGANTIKAVRSAQAFLDGLPGQIEIGGYADGETQDSRPL